MYICWIKTHTSPCDDVCRSPDYLHKMVMVHIQIENVNTYWSIALPVQALCIFFIHPFHPSSHTQTHQVEQLLIHSISCVIQSCSSLFATQTHYIMAWAVNIWRPNNGHRSFARFCLFFFYLCSSADWMTKIIIAWVFVHSVRPHPLFLAPVFFLMQFVSKAECFIFFKSSCNPVSNDLANIILNLLLYQRKAWFHQHACQAQTLSTRSALCVYLKKKFTFWQRFGS